MGRSKKDSESTDSTSEKKGQSRRDFLKVAGVTAGVAAANIATVTGAAATMGAFPQYGQPYVPEFLPKPNPVKNDAMEHVVVVMGENRSFDNLLGWLYTPKDLPPGQKFEGLAFGKYSNTSDTGAEIPAHVYEGPTDWLMSQPDPDPGEEYAHVNTQIFGTVIPASNANKSVSKMEAPFNLPSGQLSAKMDGFVKDYINNFKDTTGKDPKPEDLEVIMGGFAPPMLPVLSTLAKEFGVFDHWHSAVPSQTYCNRSFFNASTSHGYVSNKGEGGYEKWFNAAPTPTIFNRLEDAGISWCIYFDPLQIISMTGMIHAPVLEKYWRTEHFATMDKFYEDVANGTLPAYAFIEPRLVYNHNDFHPPVGKPKAGDIDGVTVYNAGVSDVRAGEALIHDIYSAIRNSKSSKGSNYLNTMLLITFDEHGGTYDHVPPPAAVPPNDLGPGEMDFTFDRLGCRVPAIVVSAYTKRGTVFNEQMHHGSVISTLSQQYGLEPLTRRDASAPTLFQALNQTKPRPASDWPQTMPQYTPPNPEAVPPHPGLANENHPLSTPARGLIGLLYARFGTEAEKKSEPATYADAYNALQKYGTGLFGVPK